MMATAPNVNEWATPQQEANLQREIQRRKDDARRSLIDIFGGIPAWAEIAENDDACEMLVNAFWYTRTRTQIESYESPAATSDYTLPLPEFQQFVRELTSDGH